VATGREAGKNRLCAAAYLAQRRLSLQAAEQRHGLDCAAAAVELGGGGAHHAEAAHPEDFLQLELVLQSRRRRLLHLAGRQTVEISTEAAGGHVLIKRLERTGVVQQPPQQVVGAELLAPIRHGRRVRIALPPRPILRARHQHLRKLVLNGARPRSSQRCVPAVAPPEHFL